MKTQQAIDYFGGRQPLSAALGIDKSATYHWGDEVPMLRQYQIQALTGGELRVATPATSGTKKAA